MGSAALNLEFGAAFFRVQKNMTENGPVSGKKKRCVVKYP